MRGRGAANGDGILSLQSNDGMPGLIDRGVAAFGVVLWGFLFHRNRFRVNNRHVLGRCLGHDLFSDRLLDNRLFRDRLFNSFCRRLFRHGCREGNRIQLDSAIVDAFGMFIVLISGGLIRVQIGQPATLDKQSRSLAIDIGDYPDDIIGHTVSRIYHSLLIHGASLVLQMLVREDIARGQLCQAGNKSILDSLFFGDLFRRLLIRRILFFLGLLSSRFLVLDLLNRNSFFGFLRRSGLLLGRFFRGLLGSRGFFLSFRSGLFLGLFHRRLLRRGLLNRRGSFLHNRRCLFGNGVLTLSKHPHRDAGEQHRQSQQQAQTFLIFHASSNSWLHVVFTGICSFSAHAAMSIWIMHESEANVPECGRPRPRGIDDP